jgi:hypothetical protein
MAPSGSDLSHNQRIHNSFFKTANKTFEPYDATDRTDDDPIGTHTNDGFVSTFKLEAKSEPLTFPKTVQPCGANSYQIKVQFNIAEVDAIASNGFTFDV